MPHPMRKSVGVTATAGRMCVATGAGLQGGVAGVAAVVMVRTKDARGTARTTGGDVVLVSIQAMDVPGPSAEAHVIDSTDGSYICTYLPTVASANCRVSVMVNGTHINGSPFAAQVAPGRTYAGSCRVFGRGLSDGVAGQTSSFKIATKDVYGNRCVQPGDSERRDAPPRRVHTPRPHAATPHLPPLAPRSSHPAPRPPAQSSAWW